MASCPLSFYEYFPVSCFFFFLNYSSIFIHVGWFQLGRSRFSLAFGKWGMSLLHKNTLWARVPRWALGSAPHLGYFIEIPRRQQWGAPTSSTQYAMHRDNGKNKSHTSTHPEPPFSAARFLSLRQVSTQTMSWSGAFHGNRKASSQAGTLQNHTGLLWAFLLLLLSLCRRFWKPCGLSSCIEMSDTQGPVCLGLPCTRKKLVFV